MAQRGFELGSSCSRLMWGNCSSPPDLCLWVGPAGSRGQWRSRMFGVCSEPPIVGLARPELFSLRSPVVPGKRQNCAEGGAVSSRTAQPGCIFLLCRAFPWKAFPQPLRKLKLPSAEAAAGFFSPENYSPPPLEGWKQLPCCTHSRGCGHRLVRSPSSNAAFGQEAFQADVGTVAASWPTPPRGLGCGKTGEGDMGKPPPPICW